LDTAQDITDNDANFIISEVRHHVNTKYTRKNVKIPNGSIYSTRLTSYGTACVPFTAKVLGPPVERELAACLNGGDCTQYYLKWLFSAAKNMKLTSGELIKSIYLALNRGEQDVRLAASACLSSFNRIPLELINGVDQLLNDHNYSVRWQAATCIASYTDTTTARQLLRAQLKREPYLNYKWHIRILLTAMKFRSGSKTLLSNRGLPRVF